MSNVLRQKLYFEPAKISIISHTTKQLQREMRAENREQRAEGKVVGANGSFREFRDFREFREFRDTGIVFDTQRTKGDTTQT